MEKTIWTCMIINLLAVIGLVWASQSEGQDAAGKSMVILPMILLVVLTGAGYFLLKAKHAGWALAVAGIPAVIIIVMLVFTLLQGIKSR